jgi:hypothetical protein
MFERFTERARQVVVLAQEEARGLTHHYIGTEHLLLGLLREEEGLAARVLESLDITVERARLEVAQIVGRGEEPTGDAIPFTPRAKHVLELALNEALALGHNYIGTEHILLGLVSENEGVAARVLLDFGADAEKVRGELFRMLSGRGARAAAAAPSPPVASVAGAGERLSVRRPAAQPHGAPSLYAQLEPEIRAQLGREPDAGDLATVLASIPGGLLARILDELGIDAAALDAAVTRARAAGPGAVDEEIERARQEHEAAIGANDIDTAMRFRKLEQKLLHERDEQLLANVRARLGLRTRPAE